MRKVWLLIILLLLVVSFRALAVSEDESLTSLEMRSSFVELERVAESRLDVEGQAPAPVSVLAPLCLAYFHLKHFNRLMPCLNRLEERVLSGDTTIITDKSMVSDSDALPFANMLRAKAYLELGNYPKSLEQAKIALSRIRDTLPYGVWPARRYRLEVLSDLSLAAALAGEKELSKTYLKELENFPLGFMGSASLTFQRNNGAARAYLALGEYEKVLYYLKEEGSSFLRALGNASWGFRGKDSAWTWVELPRAVMLGRALLQTGKMEEAKGVLDGILRHPRLSEHGDLYWLVLFDRGRIAETERDLKGAINYYQQAVEVIEQQRSTINTEANKIGFVGDKQGVYKKLIAVLVQTQRVAEAFDYLERSKSRALVDMLASKKDFAVREGDSTKLNGLLAKAEQIEMDALAQGGKPAGTNSQAAPPSAAASGQRSLVVSAVKQVMADAAPELLSLVSVSSTPIEEIQARIPEDEMLVEYYFDDKSLFIFMLSRQGLQVMRTDLAGLDTEARALRDAIASPKSEAYLPAAQQLYRQLISPIEPLLAGRSKLIIVPHGVLHYVPFAALHDGSQFLLDKYAFRLLPSASVVKYLRDQQTRKPGGILAFGNPDLGDPKYDLRFAEEEARAIIQTVPNSRAVLRKEATETALRENSAEFNYLHFATHGKFNADAPLNSALILAKDATSDGLLTVSKLYSMRIDIDLATLSACETGLGKIANGDDVVGLTRGFLYAGVSTIVASLWQVDDQATSELMRRFYEGLKNKDKREALREAQIFAREKYAHPYYWAAFQLTGNAN